ncbi:hypothetical protein FAM09_17230 [Niastella caeni]|uniref:BZIP transcription factor n=1 Tax=Niastella caeni TaxID=2569763 RepID=A0A4S8HYU5_9BACT|nr:hypothetical protein [Niastella caeni]THU38412.1 hypothetical protein FAM09_17230 [Niastella caeni]
MKRILLFCPLLIAASSSFGQITTAQNGLSQPNASTVQLGGTLLQHTNIDLGSSYNLGILKGTANYFSILNNGNVGIGTATPGVRFHVNGATHINLNAGEFLQIKMAGPQNWNRGIDYNITDADGVSNSYGFKIVGYNNDGNRILRFNHYNTSGMAFGGGNYSFENRTYFNSGIGGPYHSDLSFYLNQNTQNPGTETGIKFYTEPNPTVPLMSIMQGGNVGIGTGSPTAKLSLGNSITNVKLALWEGTTDNQYYRTGLGIAAGQFRLFVPRSDNRFSFLASENATDELLTVLGTGNVGIGISTPQTKLAVNGDITAKKVKVTQTGWADYVFHPTYKLRPLPELEQYINKQQHLPEIPSAAEVEKNGIDLGNNQALLLKKIEELTLYVIDLNKKVQQQQEEITRLKQQSRK